MRREAWAGMVEHLAGRFGLTSGFEFRPAVDILMLLLSPTSYQTLVSEYGWTPEQWHTWCATAIGQQLFGR